MSRIDEDLAGGEETREHDRPVCSASRSFLGRTAPIVEVTFGGHTHPGHVRENNEDHYVVIRRRRRRDVLLGNIPEGFMPDLNEDAYVLAVADGMGGAAFGELASLLALQSGWDLGLRDVKWTVKVDDAEVRELMQKADAYYREIDRALIAHTDLEPRLSGMGTTLTLAYTIGTEAIIAHAGDSRAYLHGRDGNLVCLTRDHTLAQELADFGMIQPDEVHTHRMRNVLTNCLGGPEVGVDPDITHIRLSDGDGLLLCTDGLTDVVKGPEIARTLDEYRTNPDAACRALIDLALKRGGPDNITVVLSRYTIPNQAPSNSSGGAV